MKISAFLAARGRTGFPKPGNLSGEGVESILPHLTRQIASQPAVRATSRAATTTVTPSLRGADLLGPLVARSDCSQQLPLPLTPEEDKDADHSD